MLLIQEQLRLCNRSLYNYEWRSRQRLVTVPFHTGGCQSKLVRGSQVQAQHTEVVLYLTCSYEKHLFAKEHWKCQKSV